MVIGKVVGEVVGAQGLRKAPMARPNLVIGQTMVDTSSRCSSLKSIKVERLR